MFYVSYNTFLVLLHEVNWSFWMLKTMFSAQKTHRQPCSKVRDIILETSFFQKKNWKKVDFSDPFHEGNQGCSRFPGSCGPRRSSTDTVIEATNDGSEHRKERRARFAYRLFTQHSWYSNAKAGEGWKFPPSPAEMASTPSILGTLSSIFRARDQFLKFCPLVF